MSTLKPRTATIPIYQGDDAERLAELRMAVAVAERQAMQSNGAPRRGGDSDPAEAIKAAQAAYDAFVDEAAERAVEVVVRSIGRRRFRDLVAAHPPRKEKNSTTGPSMSPRTSFTSVATSPDSLLTGNAAART